MQQWHFCPSHVLTHPRTSSTIQPSYVGRHEERRGRRTVMSRGINRLSGADLRRSAPGHYGDGNGLWRQVSIAADGKRRNRSWVFRWEHAGRVREMGLGSADVVRLAEAREKARQACLLRLQGIDPLEHRRAQRAAAAAATMRVLSFEQAAHAYLAAKRDEWRSQQHAQEWPASLRKHVFPVLAKIPVAQIDTPAVMRALQPIWDSKRETASRLRGRIEAILDWATVSNYRTGDNPARWSGHLEHLLA